MNASNFRSRELRALIIATCAEERIKRGIAPLSSIYGQLLEHSASRGVTLLEMTSSSIKRVWRQLKRVWFPGGRGFCNDCPGFHF